MFLTHVCPQSGVVHEIFNEIIQNLPDINVGLNNLVAVGCDGTTVNTGSTNGIICLFEKYLSKPLHWLICLLHLSELPLKTLFENLDGKTSRPSNFQGEVCRQLNSCTKLPVTKFERIRCHLDALTSI